MTVFTAWCEYDIDIAGRIFDSYEAALRVFNLCASTYDVEDFDTLKKHGLAGIDAVEVEE